MERGTIQGTMVCRETWPGEQRTRRDLQRPRAELAVDVFVGDDADAAPAAHRHLCLAPHQVLVPASSDRGVLQRSDIEVVQQTAVRWWQQHADKPLNRWSSGCTATAVSPRMVSGRVVATGRNSSEPPPSPAAGTTGYLK